MRHKILFLLMVFLCFSPAYTAQSDQLTFDTYHRPEDVNSILRSWNSKYPQLTSIIPIGKSVEQTDLLALRLAANTSESPDPDSRPAVFVTANLEGYHLVGTEAALLLAEKLLTKFGSDENITQLLTDITVYIAPLLNPDTTQEYFARNRYQRIRNSVSIDEDMDDRVDEDGFDDLNRDGMITMMRVKDPEGKWISDPSEPRLMRLSDPKKGESGIYKMYTEGLDNDEDGLGGYDMNRNYGFNWQPNYVQQGAGEYPFCFPETIVTRDFLLANPNIFGAQNFHNSGGMILRPPGAKNMGDLPMGDTTIYDYIGKKGEKILPGYRYIVIYKDLYTVYGGSIDFFVNVLGAFTFSNELDMSPTFSFPIGSEQENELEQDPEMIRMRAILEQVRQMEYHDLVLLGEHYMDWTPYTHPLYGEIEIGGMTKFGSRVPSLFQLPDTCHRNAAFCFYHADQLPHLNFEKIQVKKIDKDLYQIDVAITNTRVTPTISSLAVQKKIHRADRFKIDGTASLRAAGILTDKYRGTTQKIDTRDDSVWITSGVSSFGTLNLRLLVKGKGEIELIYDSLKGGTYTTTVTLK